MTEKKVVRMTQEGGHQDDMGERDSGLTGEKSSGRTRVRGVRDAGDQAWGRGPTVATASRGDNSVRGPSTTPSIASIASRDGLSRGLWRSQMTGIRSVRNDRGDERPNLSAPRPRSGPFKSRCAQQNGRLLEQDRFRLWQARHHRKQTSHGAGKPAAQQNSSGTPVRGEVAVYDNAPISVAQQNGSGTLVRGFLKGETRQAGHRARGKGVHASREHGREIGASPRSGEGPWPWQAGRPFERDGYNPGQAGSIRGARIYPGPFGWPGRERPPPGQARPLLPGESMPPSGRHHAGGGRRAPRDATGARPPGKPAGGLVLVARRSKAQRSAP